MSGACQTCGKPLGRNNRTGYCKHHVSAAKAQDPAWREAQRTGSKRALQANPERMEALKARLRARNTSSEHRAWAADRARQMGLAEIGRATAHTPEAVAKRSASCTATKLAWCPPHLREDYRRLIRTKHIRAAEAREIILAQEAAEVASLRRRMASYMIEEGLAA
jgi:hypothetical protein